MTTGTLSVEPSDPQQLIGYLRSTIKQLQSELAKSAAMQADAEKYRRIVLHSLAVQDHIVDNCFVYGAQIETRIDEGLGGEDFVPCTMTCDVDGVEYELALESTVYTVKERDAAYREALAGI